MRREIAAVDPGVAASFVRSMDQWLGASTTVSLLFGVTPRDPLSFAVAAVTVILAALAASYLPARRASKVDPIVALRID